MQDLPEKGKSQVEIFLNRTAHYLKTSAGAALVARTNPGRGPVGLGVRPPVVFNDGHSASIQASSSHYCRWWEGRWNAVEVWKLSGPAPEAWSEYGDGENPYAYVPIWLVDLFVAAHGGINWTKTLADNHDRLRDVLGE